MGYIKTSNNQMVIWGKVAQNATFRCFDSGKSVSNFSVKYGRAESDGQGSKKGLFINVSAWGKTGEYASGLEKGRRHLPAERGDRAGAAGARLYGGTG